MNPERDRWRAAMHMNNAAINITDTGNIDYSIFSSQHIKRKLLRIANEKNRRLSQNRTTLSFPRVPGGNPR